MKKLLALVLCVMMFVSVLPTAAFAGSVTGEVDDPLKSVAAYNKEITNMIKNTKKNVEKAYKSLTGDKVVYTSVKAMDDTLKSMVDGITDNLIEKGTKKADGTRWSKADADRIKGYVRSYLDEAVATKIADNYYKCLDSDGNRDDLKYAQLVADSVNKALNDKQFIAGYQAVATYFALGQVVKDINDKLKDEYEDFENSIDTSFQNKFAAQYPTLYWDYIDTVASADLKYELKDEALVNYLAALAAAEEEFERAETLAEEGRALAYAAADAEYAEATVIPENDYIAAEKTAQADKDAADDTAEANKTAADKKALRAYNKAVKAAEALTDPTEKEKALIEAKRVYNNKLATNESTYNDTLAANEVDYLAALEAAQDAYDVATADAQADWEDATDAAEDAYTEAMTKATEIYDFKEALIEAEYDYIEDMPVNPWGEVVWAHIGSTT